MQLPLHLVYDFSPEQTPERLPDYISALRQRLNSVYSQLRDNLRQAFDVQDKLYNMKARAIEFLPGQNVYLFTPHVQPGCAPKLHRYWKAGFQIVRKTFNVDYEIVNVSSGQLLVVHQNRLKLMTTLPGHLQARQNVPPHQPDDQQVGENQASGLLPHPLWPEDVLLEVPLTAPQALNPRRQRNMPARLEDYHLV